MKLLADEDIEKQTARGVLRNLPGLDLVRAQDVGLQGVDDPAVLEWAAREGRALITCDVSTISDFAYERIANGKPMPRVIALRRPISIGEAIEDSLTLRKGREMLQLAEREAC